MGRLSTYLGGAIRKGKRKLSHFMSGGPALGTLGQDALRPAVLGVAKVSKVPKKISPKQMTPPAGSPSRSLMTPFEASPGATGPALGSVTSREGPATFYDDMMPWSDAVDEGVGGSGSASAADMSAGSYGETAAGISAGTEDSIPGGSYADDTSLSGPMAELWEELKAGAAELGISLEEYADRLLKEYPWMAATLGVASGAALIALLYSLGSGAAATTTTAAKKNKAPSKKSPKPSYMSKAEHEAWKATRGKSGSVSRKEFHENIWMPPKKPKPPKKRAVGRTTPAKGKKKGTSKGRGKLVKFKDKKTGKWVKFYAKK